METLPNMAYFVAGALGLGLAACSGFRVFVPLLAASAAYHFGYLTPAAGFAWLGTWTALLTLATATVLEIAGYYVPIVDHFLDTLTTPASFVAGTILMTSALPHLDPTLRWTLGILVGGGTAGLVQTGTALLRGASTPPPGALPIPFWPRSKTRWRWAAWRSRCCCPWLRPALWWRCWYSSSAGCAGGWPGAATPCRVDRQFFATGQKQCAGPGVSLPPHLNL
ncbi:DUF4126 domain-containing protein [Hymenobacter lapidarius]|uniref:DUF4126 domain-containing protein n=1 Tax=Hymenobacter lapidarius TaxID=1908237 RepID=UPI000AA6ACA0|nr:DUF4126 domain-containing protein [Hymenobacter lapidarius]